MTQERTMQLKVKKRGNSLSVIIPKELAIGLNVDDGDILYVSKTADGYQLSAFDPDFAQKMDIARKGIKKYRNALISLGQ